MGVEEFLELFIKELEQNADLRQYYRLLNNKSRYLWRKAYLEQRLRYVCDKAGQPPGNVWDVGCGYGTTAILMALNGFKVFGNTLEFYYSQLERRMEYWSRYGNIDHLKIEYANLFDMPVQKEFYDIIIVQDTLHHLEPIHDALEIFSDSLKPGGRMIATEENGSSLFIRIKNFSKRGFNRISTYYDERLEKTIPFGNENARDLNAWRRLLEETKFELPSGHSEFVRLFPHFFYNDNNYSEIPQRELTIAQKLPRVKKYLFFGINFTAIKKTDYEV